MQETKLHECRTGQVLFSPGNKGRTFFLARCVIAKTELIFNRFQRNPNDQIQGF